MATSKLIEALTLDAMTHNPSEARRLIFAEREKVVEYRHDERARPAVVRWCDEQLVAIDAVLKTLPMDPDEPDTEATLASREDAITDARNRATGRYR